MSLLDSFILGLVQGLTEFLPVSGSGHLTLLGSWLGASGHEGDPYLFFVVATHFGTLMAILIYYRRDLAALIAAFFRTLGRGGRSLEGDRPHMKMIGIIVAATLPALIVGLTLKDLLERVFERPLPAALFLSVTGLILFSTRWTGPRANDAVGWRSGLLTGVAQACAILPGISRSGSTISMALAAGVERREAARFSFILSVPALAGATLLEVLDIGSLAQVDWPVIALGTVTAFVSGYLSLVWLIRLLARQGFWKFAFYCWALSALAVLMITLGAL